MATFWTKFLFEIIKCSYKLYFVQIPLIIVVLMTATASCCGKSTLYI